MNFRHLANLAQLQIKYIEPKLTEALRFFYYYGSVLSRLLNKSIS